MMFELLAIIFLLMILTLAIYWMADEFDLEEHESKRVFQPYHTPSPQGQYSVVEHPRGTLALGVITPPPST